MSSVVLVTTANNPPEGMPILEMTNVATRQITAKAAVFFWAASGIEKIVIADATGGRLLHDDDISLLSKMNVYVEQISYIQDEEVVKNKGKGYGEGMLIKHALKSSEILSNERSFFKCTGKIYCRNIDKIIEAIDANNIKNFFWRRIREDHLLNRWADTRLFYATKAFCEEKIIPAYLKVDESICPVEHECFKVVDKDLEAATSMRPMISGFSGGTGKQYFDSSLGYLDHNFPCWVGF